jgi:hypothetical protein
MIKRIIPLVLVFTLFTHSAFAVSPKLVPSKPPTQPGSGTGTVTIVANVVNDNGGTAGVGMFAYSINGGPTTYFLSDTKTLTLTAGLSYTIVGRYPSSEASLTGDTYAITNCVPFVLTSGGTAQCVITFDDVAPVE